MRLASAFATSVLLALSCDYGDTTQAKAPADAAEACDLACARVEALSCSGPLPEALSATCGECSNLSSLALFDQCESVIKLYYECLGKQGNADCDGYEDDCAVHRAAMDACLNGQPSTSGFCPTDYPVDCGDGFCCPASHPECRAGGLCGLAAGGDGGAAGAGG